MVYNANGFYFHKARLLIEFNSLLVGNKGLLACQGYSYEEFPEAFDMYPFTDRANSSGTGINVSFYGGLSLGIFFLKTYCYENQSSN